MDKNENSLSIVIVGHVDHGKSTIIGRLYADTKSLPEGKLEAVRDMCRRNSKPFEYAFLLDALKDERAQGITIDAARTFFKTDLRRYTIIDAPGHIEFLKNMITGASHAEAALLVIDAGEGIRENSKRHGYMLSMLGIGQIAVLINKMDLVGYDRAAFEAIKTEYGSFLAEIGIKPMYYIPVSGMHGGNIAVKSSEMPWYTGLTTLQALDRFTPGRPLDTAPLRIPVQDVYKFTAMGDTRRIIAGAVESGKISKGDKIMFFPSGKKTTVAAIEAFNRQEICTESAGAAVGFTVTEQIYIKRGEICSLIDERAPQVSTMVKASVFWLGAEPLGMEKKYLIKIGTARVFAHIADITKVIDASTLSVTYKEEISRHEVGECIIEFEKPAAFELAGETKALGRFVIVDENEISGGGIILEALNDDMSGLRKKVMLRNFKWEQSAITQIDRAEKYGQRAVMVMVTGSGVERKKTIAKAIEAKLFEQGRFVYYLGMGSVVYGVDSDINKSNKHSKIERREHIRRLAEIANIMLDAGVILIVTAVNITNADIGLMETVITGNRVIKVLASEEGMPQWEYDSDYIVENDEPPENAADAVIKLL